MAIVKLIHMSTVIISISLFMLRGFGLFTAAGFMRQRWLRVMPHLNDSLLLLSAILLLINSEYSLWLDHWLSAKIVALVVYILLGLVALKWAKTRRQQILAWCGAILVFAYIVSVALTKQPSGFF